MIIAEIHALTPERGAGEKRTIYVWVDRQIESCSDEDDKFYSPQEAARDWIAFRNSNT